MNTPTASRCQRIIDMIDECLAELELAPPPAVLLQSSPALSVAGIGGAPLSRMAGVAGGRRRPCRTD
jgi:hypothetical protein